MFTGIVKAIGTVSSIVSQPGSTRLEIDAEGIAGLVGRGDSVAVNGCCLTATSVSDSIVSFDAVPETLSRTNLGSLGEKASVNLEPAIAAGEPLGGHFVQGHIDCIGEVVSLSADGDSLRAGLRFPAEFSRYVAPKGSVALDGVSLTVADCKDNYLEVVLVPHTIKVTTLGSWEAGYRPNIEFDILAKYVERLAGPLLGKRQSLK
jgi:riboflavin synthase